MVVRDLATGADTPLTFNRADAPRLVWTEIHAPRWFPGGDRVLYVTGSTESTNAVSQPADGAGAARAITRARRAIVTPDGGKLVFAIDDRWELEVGSWELGVEAPLVFLEQLGVGWELI
jgi:hypothetical protein